MSKIAKTILEWGYSPPTFFEEPISLLYEGGTITIDNGAVRGEFDASKFDLGRKFVNAATKYVESHFRAQNLHLARKFEVSFVTIMRVDANGKRHLSLLVDVARTTSEGGRVDIAIRNKSGGFESDSKSERIKYQNTLRINYDQLIKRDKYFCKNA